MERKRIPYGTKLPVKLTLRQRDLILEHSLDDPEYVRVAPVDGKGIRVDLSLDEIEEIRDTSHLKRTIPRTRSSRRSSMRCSTSCRSSSMNMMTRET